MLTREAEQTLRIVQHLALPEILQSGSTAMAIHNELGIPGVLLRGILRRLTLAGIINSRRGRVGGVNLVESALRLRLLDVLNAVDSGKARCNPRLWDADSTQKADDPVRALFIKAQEKAHDVFAGVTVSQLATRAGK